MDTETAQGSGLVIGTAISTVAFALGGASVFFYHPVAWSWNSPFATAIFALTALCAGLAVMSLILMRAHDREAGDLQRRIAESRRYAQELLSRVQLSAKFGADEDSEAQESIERMAKESLDRALQIRREIDANTEKLLAESLKRAKQKLETDADAVQTPKVERSA